MYALALLRFINNINIPPWTNLRDYPFTKIFRDCVLNIISNQVFKQIIYSIYVHSPLFICKMHLIMSKPVSSVPRCYWSASNYIMITSYWELHCDNIFANNLPWRIKRAIKKQMIVRAYYLVFRYSVIPIRFANSFFFVIFPLLFSLSSHFVIILWCHSQPLLNRLYPASF